MNGQKAEMKRTGPTNERTKELIAEMQKLGNDKDASIWKSVAEELLKSSRARREVNLVTLNRFTNENEVIIVPGKVLGNGELNHKLTIAAFKASQSAINKIKQSGSKYITLYDLMRTNPEGNKIRIIG